MISAPTSDPMRELFQAGVTDVHVVGDGGRAAGLAGLLLLLGGLWSIVGAAAITLLIPVALYGGVELLFSSGGTRPWL